MKRNFLVSASLGMALLLMGANSIQAQSYFYGYYNPETHRFHTNDVASTGYDETIYPGSTFYELRYGPSTPVAKEQPATVRILVPDPQARVYFDAYETKATGGIRAFQTPALTPGQTYKYHLKVTWTKAGQEVALERDVEVAAGQTLLLNFNHAVATAAGKTAAPSKK